MSKTVDERVVEMRFDNKQFEQNVQTSLSTLEKLKRSLNLDGAVKGLENVNSAAKEFNMSGLSSAVDTVHAKFSAFEVMAVTALANITNSALNTGKRLLASLSVDQISAGWEKFGNKTTSVGTLISQGYDLETVNEQLARLNWFTDETSYNFTDMVANISKFTASGKGLEESVTAMEGIANWAALSGQNAGTASRAMYQLAQAMSAGYMRLEDYKSIQNASMDTEEFRQKCLDAAVALGTLKENSDGTYESLVKNTGAFNLSQFTSHLTEDAWMTSDVMMKVFNDYSAAVDQIYEYAEEKGITASQAIEELGDSVDGFGLKAFRAAQEARTWADVVDSVKDAVSTGWMNTFEIIFGNYEEAKELWTDLANAMYDVFAAGAEDRNSMLEEWKELGGRTALVETFWTTWENVADVLSTVKEAFRDIFPKMTAERLYNITVGMKEFALHLKLSDSASKNLKSTFKGLFAILDIAGQAFSALFKVIPPLFGGLEHLGGGILNVTGGMGEWLVALDEFIKKNDIFGKAVQGVIDFIVKAADEFKSFAKEVKDKFNLPDLDTVKESLKGFLELLREKIKVPGLELVHTVLERIHERMSQVGDAAGSMKSGFLTAMDAMGEALANCKFLQLLQALWNGAKTIVGGIANAFGELADTLIKKLGKADFSGIIDLLNGLSIGGVALGISKFLKSFTEPLDGLQGILDGVTGILDGVRGCFEAYQTQLKAGTLLKIAAAIAVLAASIVAISLIDSEKLSASLGAITVLFANLLGSMAIFNKISGSKDGTTKACVAMIAMSAAVLILAGAMKKVAELDWEGVAKGLISIAGLSAILVASAKIMSSGSGQLVKGATSLVVFAAAIKILASVCEDLSKLEWGELAKGLVGVGVLLGEVALFLRTAKFGGKAISTATGIVILSAALKILASVCGDFGQMEWGEIAKGLASVGVLLLEVAAFTKLTGNAKHVVSTSIALIGIAAAMKIFASAMGGFAKLSLAEIAKGLFAMGGALAEVMLAMKFMPKNVAGIGAGLIIVGAALEIMAHALGKMGNFSWEQIAKSLVTMGVALAELAIGLNFMKGTLGGSAALLVAAAALTVLTPVLSILGAMSWMSIAKGLVTIAGAFAVLGIAGAVLTPLVPTILGLGGAFALVGVGVLAAGVGLLAAGAGLSALAVGFTALAAASTAGATAIVAGLTVIITGVASLIPAVIAKIGEGIIAFCGVIAGGAPAIGAAVTAVVLSLVGVLVECVPAIADGVLALLDGVLAALVTYTPSIINSIFLFLIAVLEGVAQHMPGLIKAAIDVLMAFFSGIVDALGGINTDVLLKGIVGIGLLSAIMLALSAVASLVPGAMVGILGMGAVVAELALVLAAVGLLAQLPGLSWLIGEGGKLLQGIGTAIGQFVGGIVGGFMSSVSSRFPQIGADLAAFMTNIQPFIEGASQISPATMDGVKALAEAIIVLTAADILQGVASWFTGGSSLSSFAAELVPFGEAMKEFSIVIAGMDANLVANAAMAGKTLAEMATTLPNSGGVVGFFAGENDMTAFGEQLVPFGEAMMAFSLAIKGLDANAVTAAAIAGKAMVEMAATIPNSGGVVGFFAGENDMRSFGDQLVPFGEAMMDFSTAVKGLDADAIVNSATAGKALMELAHTIPNSGGAVAFFAGENNMDLFGEQLVPFGKAMKSYSDAISGMDATAIENSATAGKSLAELANTLPNTGGVVSWFTGDNDIGAFGDSLVVFGENFAKYSDYMRAVDAGIVTATTNAATSIVELQKSLPKEGGWFSSEQTLSDFGSDMANFGYYFSSYYSYISGVDTGLLSSVITQTNRLVEMANGMAGLDVSGMSSFGSALKKLGEMGVTEFVNAFQNAESKVRTVATTMLTAFVNSANSQKTSLTATFTALVQAVLTAINGKQNEFLTAGSTLMVRFIAGVRSQDNGSRSTFTTIISGCLTMIKNKYTEFQSVGTQTMVKLIAGARTKDAEARSTFTNIISGCLTAIKNKYSEFQTAGEQCMIKLIAGARSKEPDLKNSFASALGGVLSGIKNDYYSQFHDAAAYLVDGFANGIDANAYKAEARGKAMAAAAARAARQELDEHSPSKVGYQIGDFFGIAFVNAIDDYADKAYKASSEMASAAKTGLSNAISKVKDYIENGIDSQPTIRPVLDLSNVEAGAGELSALFSRAQALSISTGMNRQEDSDVQNGENVPEKGSTFKFIQNNYSPKALSRVEIYRQTKNQFSTFERKVKA